MVLRGGRGVAVVVRRNWGWKLSKFPWLFFFFNLSFKHRNWHSFHLYVLSIFGVFVPSISFKRLTNPHSPVIRGTTWFLFDNRKLHYVFCPKAYVRGGTMTINTLIRHIPGILFSKWSLTLDWVPSHLIVWTRMMNNLINQLMNIKIKSFMITE